MNNQFNLKLIRFYTPSIKITSMKSIGIYRSTVNQTEKSSRTTIPKPVAKALGLTNKEKIVWDIQVDADEMIYVIVTKEKNKDL